jgi:hypothetical protein
MKARWVISLKNQPSRYVISMKADTGAVDVLGGITVGTKRAPRGGPSGTPVRNQKGMKRHSRHDLSFLKAEGREVL